MPWTIKGRLVWSLVMLDYILVHIAQEVRVRQSDNAVHIVILTMRCPLAILLSRVLQDPCVALHDVALHDDHLCQDGGGQH